MNQRFALKCVGVLIEIFSIIAGLGVPLVFCIIMPFIRTYQYYIQDNGTGLAVGIKNGLIAVCGSPLLAVIIFIPLFIIGAGIYTWCDEKDQEEKDQQEQQMAAMQAQMNQQQNPMNDFYIVKEDDPSRSDAGIAQMNWIMEQKRKEAEAIVVETEDISDD